MKKCPQCGRVYKDTDYYCLSDNQRLINYTTEQSEQDQLRQRKQQEPQQNLPRCPVCQSTNLKKISTAAKVASGFAFGLFSTTARSQFECKNCGYKF